MATMKLLIVSLCMLAVAVESMIYTPPVCGCKPDTPVCASNWQTYPSRCEMNCDYRYPEGALYVIYNGRCEDILPFMNNGGYPNILPHNPNNWGYPDVLPINPNNNWEYPYNNWEYPNNNWGIPNV